MFSILPVTGLPEIAAGDDLAALLAAHLDEAEMGWRPESIAISRTDTMMQNAGDRERVARTALEFANALRT
jgi:F420-0:gamma-glutamyl ligase